METTELNQEKARFDTRLPKKQKMLFERAARLGGYRNLTDFVIVTVHQRAKEIISETEKIIASEKDRELFFEAITREGKPNKKLTDAANEFKALFSK